MHSSPPIVSAHRLARLLAWARLALAWAAMVLFSEDAPLLDLRRCIRRVRLLSLDRLARMVRNLVIVRAAQMAGPRARRRTVRAFAPPGFARRMRPSRILRSCGGSALRRVLRDRDPARRMARITEALRDIDRLARKLVRRLRRGLTRLRPLVMRRPPSSLVCSFAAPAPFAADTS
jgi:hypothetical protein